MNRKALRLLAHLSISSVLVLGMAVGPSLFADDGPNHQVANTNFGVSGGNVNDSSRAFCCSGTLGSLVEAGGVFYILSNNHVLARSDQAAPGEDISQPGLVDNGCQIPPIVADFTAASPLGTNVDAALAQLRTGEMNTSGTIEDIGTISGVVRAPSVGLAVEKSGRTTGLTTGSIGSVNTSVRVQYQKRCGSGKKFTVSYTNQVVINGSTFSAGGDSGSLIVSNDACHQPVALLFAGSRTSTIGNPVGEVLTALSSALGSTVSFVGDNCNTTKHRTASDVPVELSSNSIKRATKAMRSQEVDLMSRPEIIGVGIGAPDDGSADAAIVVYIDVNYPLSARIPRQINGVRVKRVYTETFVAY